jgi:DNA-binding XRE family transcriptional regulator
MTDYAVNDMQLNGDDFLYMFSISGLAKQFERGNPKYIAGKSGIDLAVETIQKLRPELIAAAPQFRSYRTPEYWAGWALAHYQWTTAESFAAILRNLPFAQIIMMYPTLHEADISKFIAVANGIIQRENQQTNLKRLRGEAGLSQSQLSRVANVSTRSIQMYEQRNKDINKAQAITLAKIARALVCNIEDLLEVEIA